MLLFVFKKHKETTPYQYFYNELKYLKPKICCTFSLSSKVAKVSFPSYRTLRGETNLYFISAIE